jgi:GSH-dependent disulfide-bond oxidoreductase
MLRRLLKFPPLKNYNTPKIISLKKARRMSTEISEIIWMPPKQIEDLFVKTEGNEFASINAPTAGARVQADVPRGDAEIQLYSLGTPNGVKVTILMEELEELGLAKYDTHNIMINTGEQFNSGFVNINPNSKIPACIVKSTKGTDLALFESGSINLYLCEKYNVFIPSNEEEKAACMNWVFWQMGCQGPFTGQFGHFFCYAPSTAINERDYGVARYGMEVLRLCDVLEKQLVANSSSDDESAVAYLVGKNYTLADIMVYPWVAWLRVGYVHGASGKTANEFLGLDAKYPNVMKWADNIGKRPAVARGVTVNQPWKYETVKPWLQVDGEAGNKKE